MKSGFLTSLTLLGHGGRIPPLLAFFLASVMMWCYLHMHLMEADPSAYPAMKFLDEFAGIEKSQNRLPHWKQDRATYFVTYRLHDSVPEVLMNLWRTQRDQWCLEHPRPWSGNTEAEYHKRFSSTIDRYLDDGHGSCLLLEPANAEIVAGAFHHYDKRNYLLHAWVIMPNHVHVLVSPGESISLNQIVAGWKRFTGTRINAHSGACGAFWQKDYFDRLIRDCDHFLNVARYIRRNPLKAKLPTGSFKIHETPWVRRLLS
jgi:REP element-mobilizing transposase RayT